MALVVGIWAGGGRWAEAACQPASPAVVPYPTPLLFASEVLTVSWRVDPACGVVETGLLMGRDPGAMTPVGQPIYGYRDRYEQSIPVKEGGQYALAAYARDETGQVVQSPPVPVTVVTPPPPLPADDTHGSHGPLPFYTGSHGALPSYTGTDADFLEPAGEPHFASLRRATLVSWGTWNFPDYGSTGVSASRYVSSTHRDEVLAEQTASLAAGGRSFAPNPSDVRAALDGLDAEFRRLLYPRPGLYNVSCTFEVDSLTPDRQGCTYATHYYFGTYYYGVPVAYVENASQLYARTSQSSARSSLTYFIPAAPPGKRVASARLVAYVSGYGNLSAIRLSGKAPVQVDPFPSCAREGSYCYMWVTWDFTEEARALAATGGGELLLALDPIPPKVESWPWGWVGQQSTAEWGFRVNVNYPWRHSAYPWDGLVLTFEEDCPQALTVEVKPSTLRPHIPTILRPGISDLPATAIVEARVRVCPTPGQAPDPVEVTFEARPPTAGTRDAGGHLHGTSTRPTGAFEDLDRGQALNSCTVTKFTDGAGSCAVRFRAFEPSGVETIVARAGSFPDAQTKVTIQIPGLGNLAQDQSPVAHTYNLTGETAHHTDNHWGTQHTRDATVLVSKDFYEQFSAVLNLNDMSLPWGGIFDIDGDWNFRAKPYHQLHRQGTSVDIERCALSAIANNPSDPCADEPGVVVSKPYIERRCLSRGRGWLEKEENIHCEFPR